MKRSVLILLLILSITISYAQEKQNENMRFLEKNIPKFGLIHETSYQAGYSMTYKYEYSLMNGILTETGTYVSTQQKFTSTVDLKDLIKVEKNIQDGKHESLVLTFKEGAVSFVNGNFKEKQNVISIPFCTKTTQNSSLKLKCEKAKHSFNDAFTLKAIQTLQGIITGSK